MQQPEQSFHQSKRKVNRASAHHAWLSSEFTAYGRRLTAQFVVSAEKPGMSRLEFSESIHSDVPLVIGELIHNLRSALDIMVCDIARRQGITPGKRLSFPIEETKGALSKRLKEDYFTALGSDFKDVMLAAEPYLDGDALIYGLSKLDNLDKHQLIIPLMNVAWTRPAVDLLAEKLTRDFGLQPGAIVGIGGGMPMLLREGEEMATLDAASMFPDPISSDRPATALFAKGLPFAGQHILTVLDDMKHRVIAVLEDFAPLG